MKSLIIYCTFNMNGWSDIYVRWTTKWKLFFIHIFLQYFAYVAAGWDLLN